MGRKKQVDKEELIEYAKELYLTPDEYGNHLYSLREITQKIRQKFDKNLTAQTILNWVKKYGWDKVWEEGVRYGVTELIAKVKEDKLKEEQFKEQIGKVKRNNAVMDINIRKLAYKHIMENGFQNTTEAIRAYEVATKSLQNNDLIEKLTQEVYEPRIELVIKGFDDDDD
jgi:hypothetical protein